MTKRQAPIPCATKELALVVMQPHGPPKKPKGSGNRLNDLQRLQILAQLESPDPPSKSAIARAFGVSDAAILKLQKNKATLLARTAGMTPLVLAKTFRYQPPTHPQVEQALAAWVVRFRRLRVELPPSLVLAKADEIARTMGHSEHDFTAKWGWLGKFRRRYDLGATLLYGEEASVDKEDPFLLAALDDLCQIISDYTPSTVYNMDETGLFFRVQPRYTLTAPDEDTRDVRGRKVAKERVSLVVCANGDGSNKVPLAMIGKPVAPVCSLKTPWPLAYYSQTNAWVDGQVFKAWFKDVFVPSVRSHTNEPVLLVLDNAPGHYDETEYDGIRVKFLPPNCTSWRQPCDLGIIAALKKRYRYKLMKKVLTFMDLPPEVQLAKVEAVARARPGTYGVDHGRPAHLMDAAQMITAAWADMSDVTIKNSFIKANIGVVYLDDTIGPEEEIAPGFVDSFIANIEGDEWESIMQCDDPRSDCYRSSCIAELYH